VSVNARTAASSGARSRGCWFSWWGAVPVELSLEVPGLVPGAPELGAQVLNLGHETGDLGAAGLGQLVDALGSGFGSGQVDLGVGSQRVELGSDD